MAKVTVHELRSLAAISKLEMSDEELETLVPDIQSVLDYASSLIQIARDVRQKTELVKPSNIVREDKAILGNFEEIIDLAPQREGNFIAVPSIIKQEPS